MFCQRIGQLHRKYDPKHFSNIVKLIVTSIFLSASQVFIFTYVLCSLIYIFTTCSYMLFFSIIGWIILTDYAEEKKETLGEVLNGDRLVSAPYRLEFLTKKDSQAVCRKNLTKEEVSQFRNVVNRHYYYKFYIDDLPVWGFIGWIKMLDSSGRNERYFFASIFILRFILIRTV